MTGQAAEHYGVPSTGAPFRIRPGRLRHRPPGSASVGRTKASNRLHRGPKPALAMACRTARAFSISAAEMSRPDSTRSRTLGASLLSGASARVRRGWHRSGPARSSFHAVTSLRRRYGRSSALNLGAEIVFEYRRLRRGSAGRYPASTSLVEQTFAAHRSGPRPATALPDARQTRPPDRAPAIISAASPTERVIGPPVSNSPASG